MLRPFSVTLCAWAVAASVTSCGGAAGEETPPAAEIEAARLIEQLGDPSFLSREGAVRRLREIGLPAMTPLKSAAGHRNLEIRYRVKRLLVEVEQIDHERRISEFEKNPEAADDDALPGLRRFREMVGSDTTSLRFFLEMQRSEPHLYRLAPAGGAPLEARYDTRCGDLQFDYNMMQRRQRIPERVAALMFLGSDPKHNESDLAANILYGMVHCNEFRTAITGNTQQSPALRKIVGLWVGKPSAGIAYQRLMLAMQFDFREGLAPAEQMLRGPVLGFQKQYALLAVGRFGSRDQLEVVEKHLSDATVLTTSTVNNKVTYTSQMGDVALAVALHLSEQNPSTYGFKTMQKHPQYLYGPNTVGFANAEDREAAHKKWKAWKATQPPPPPAEAELPAP